MAEVKKSTKNWVLWIGIVILLAIGVYVFMRSSASADVVSITTGGYKFEVLSDKTFTLTDAGTSDGVHAYRLKEPVALNSGIGLRVRQSSTNIIVNKGLAWVGSNSEGIFSLQSNNALVGIYPSIVGNHKIIADIISGTTKTQIVLYFNTLKPGSTPTPVKSVISSPVIPPIQYSQTPAASVTSTSACTTNSAGQTICS